MTDFSLCFEIIVVFVAPTITAIICIVIFGKKSKVTLKKIVKSIADLWWDSI